MNKNDTLWKILNLFWIPITFIPFFNGLGFIYAGWRVKQTRWIDEGIIYMIPFILLSFTIFDEIIVYIGIILLLIGIIRALMIAKPFLEKLEESDNKTDKKDIHNKNTIPQKTSTTIGKNNVKNKKTFEISIENLRNNTNIDSEKIDKMIEYKNSGYIFTSIDDLSQKIGLNEYERTELEKIVYKKEKVSNTRILDI